MPPRKVNHLISPNLLSLAHEFPANVIYLFWAELARVSPHNSSHRDGFNSNKPLATSAGKPVALCWLRVLPNLRYDFKVTT